MSEKQKPCITFGAQMGDVRSDEAVAPHLIALRKLLDKYCKGPYSSAVDEFAPIARVDGDLWHWNLEGCDKLRWSRKGRYITVDVGVPRSRWDGKSSFEIRDYLMKNLKRALTLMVERIKKEKFEVDENQLFADLEKVEKEFLRKDE